VWITGACGVQVTSCNFEENGGQVVPGPKLQHNLLLFHCDDVQVHDSRLVGSAFGSGVVISCCRDVEISECIIARNAHYGALVSESRSVSFDDCLVEGNDETGVMIEFLYRGSRSVTLQANQIQYNRGYGVAAHGVADLTLRANRLRGNALGDEPNIGEQRRIITNRSASIPPSEDSGGS
jgi:nitrous oxidase accessory protein NosD